VGQNLTTKKSQKRSIEGPLILQHTMSTPRFSKAPYRCSMTSTVLLFAIDSIGSHKASRKDEANCKYVSMYNEEINRGKSYRHNVAEDKRLRQQFGKTWQISHDPRNEFFLHHDPGFVIEAIRTDTCPHTHEFHP
jgi:hypothetical protein